MAYVYTYPLPLGPHSQLLIPPISVIREYQVELPVLYSRFLPALCCTHGSLYMSVLISQFIPSYPRLLPPALVCCLSPSASLGPGFCFLSSLFLSTPAHTLLSFHLAIHLALFVALMQGISYSAEQCVGEVAFSLGFQLSHLAVGRDVELHV